jgi:hypothetical protein
MAKIQFPAVILTKGSGSRIREEVSLYDEDGVYNERGGEGTPEKLENVDVELEELLVFSSDFKGCFNRDG